MSTIVLRSVKGSPLTNTEVDANFNNLNTDKIQSITSTDGSVSITSSGTSRNLSVAFTTDVNCLIRNTTGATLTKGTAVYISGATGQNPTVSKARADIDATSAQTLGLISADLANNTDGYVTVIGLIANIDTSAYTDGAQLYLSPTVAGALTTTKPFGGDHLVYVAVVEHAHPTQGKLFVKVQNGYEMDELHNVSAQSPTSGQTLIYNATTSLWEKANLTAGTGISVSNGAGSITVANSGVTSAVAGTGISVSSGTGAVTISNTGVTSVTGTSPVESSGGATPAISLASGYGDTQNPFASKTANFVLAAPSGAAGAPTFRAIVAADIPTLNQNTTGSSGSCTGNAATATTATTANATNTANNFQMNSLGIGTAGSGTAGEIRATNNITAYYSDERLKTKVGDIEDPIGKVRAIKTMLYHANEIAVSLGYDASVIEVGVTAQSVQAVQPQAVAPAPIDEQYLTVRYERLVPLLIEAIKELSDKVIVLEEKLKEGA